MLLGRWGTSQYTPSTSHLGIPMEMVALAELVALADLAERGHCRP